MEPRSLRPWVVLLTFCCFAFEFRARLVCGSSGVLVPLKVDKIRKARLKPYEKALKRFKYQESLDAAVQVRRTVRC